MLSRYKSVSKENNTEIYIKKSRFIATVKPVKTEQEALHFVDNIKTQYKDATHNVFAYQVGLHNDLKRQNDDGEPSGTAGKPILDVLEQEDVRNTAVVVTRYFGGIKLGASGLIRAYRQSAKAGLKEAGVITNVLYHELQITMDYTYLGKFQNELDNRDWVLRDISYQDKVMMRVAVLPNDYDELESFLKDLTGGRVQLELHGSLYLLHHKEG